MKNDLFEKATDLKTKIQHIENFLNADQNFQIRYYFKYQRAEFGLRPGEMFEDHILYPSKTMREKIISLYKEELQKLKDEFDKL